MIGFKKIIYFLTFLLVFSSCSDMSEKTVEKETTPKEFAVCDSDPEIISKIMTLKITNELTCLESNLELFIQVVDGVNTKKGYLSQTDLMLFLKNNFNSLDDSQLDAISALFDLNSLILGDDKEYISSSNVKKLIVLMKNFNSLMVDNNIYDFFSTENKIDFYDHNQGKIVIDKAFSELSQKVLATITDKNRSLDILELIKKLRNNDNKEILDHVTKMLFVKKVLIGGSKNFVTTSEIKKLLTMLGGIARVSFDFINVPYTNTKSFEDEKMVRSLREGVEFTIDKLDLNSRGSEIVFEYNDIKYVVDEFFPDFSIFTRYKDSFLKSKNVFMGNNSEYFTAKELFNLLGDKVYKNLNQGVFFYRTYNTNKNIMNSTSSINSNIPKVLIRTPQDRQSLKNYNRISQKYMFFKGSEYAPVFDRTYVRNARGMFEIAVYEDLITEFFKVYGTKRSGTVNGYILTLEQLQDFMEDFKDLFEGEGFILPGRARSTAETITLMTSLFHSQSDGTGELEVNEFVEFSITMFSSLNLANTMSDELNKICPLDYKGRYYADCFRHNILNVLDLPVNKSQKVSDFVPKLKSYLSNLSLNERNDYLSSTAQFSRTCFKFSDGSEVPMDFGDGIVTWAGLLTIEQAIARFDKNKTNILEPSEVNDVYRIYKSAIIAMLPYKFLEKYAEDFFRYIVKYSKVPEVPEINGFSDFFSALSEGWDFVKFTFKSDKEKEASADRATFASVLKIIKANSPSSLEDDFDCDILK